MAQQQLRDPATGQFLFKPQRRKGEVLRAVGYTRVSTERQAESGISLEAQDFQIRGHCDLRNKSEAGDAIDLVDVLSDPGKSAKNLTNRPGLQTIMKMAREGSIDAIIIWRLDRLFRNLHDQNSTIKRWDEQGVKLISTHDMLDTSTAIGRLYLNMTGAINQYESEQTGERVKLVKDRKFERLEYGGGSPPLGWCISDDLGPGGKKMLEPEPLELAILEAIQELHDQGNGINRICAELTRRGFVNRHGGTTWSSKTVWKALRGMGEDGFHDKSGAAVSPADKS